MKISIIIPALNEQSNLARLLDELAEVQAIGHEVIVVDGGSTDGSLKLAAGKADHCISHDRGRALQMNAGAELASGDILMFLHADTRLPKGFPDAVETACNFGKPAWGFFRVILSGNHWFFRVIEASMNLRSRFTSIATGDQCLFVTRELFMEAGGYMKIPLMEDIALCRQLGRLCRPVIIEQAVITSSRRWQRRGVIRTVVSMWCLRLAYFLGVSPARLGRYYYG